MSEEELKEEERKELARKSAILTEQASNGKDIQTACAIAGISENEFHNSEELQRAFETGQTIRHASILEQLTSLGSVGMDVTKSCAIAEISEAEFYASEEMQKAYRIGQYKGEYLWRKSIFKGAKDGIPQMCKLFQKLIEDTVIIPNTEINLGDYYEVELHTDEPTEDKPEQNDDHGAGGLAPAGEID